MCKYWELSGVFFLQIFRAGPKRPSRNPKNYGGSGISPIVEYVSSKRTGHPKGCSLQTGVQKVKKNELGRLNNRASESFAANVLGFFVGCIPVFFGTKVVEIGFLSSTIPRPDRIPGNLGQDPARLHCFSPQVLKTFCVGAILFSQKIIPEVWVVGSCFQCQFWTLTKKDERKRANGALNFRGV